VKLSPLFDTAYLQFFVVVVFGFVEWIGIRS
jgi:ABC-type protease/lipase transport system fused ATPase/permease subunit